MIGYLYLSFFCIMFMHLFENNMWAFLFFGVLNSIFVGNACNRYDTLLNRIKKLEDSQAEKKDGVSDEK